MADEQAMPKTTGFEEIFSRMREEDKQKFNRLKANYRSRIMETFADVLPFHDWTTVDDRLMDANINWLIGLFERAARAEGINEAARRAATGPDADTEIVTSHAA